MVIDHGIFRTSASQRPWDYPKELEGFLLSREVENCSEWTIRAYRERVSRFLSFAGVSNLQDFERSDIDRWLIHLRNRGCSPHWVESNYRALRTFFNWCVAEEFIPRLPMRNIKPPRLPKIAKPFLTEAERDMMLALCPPSLFTGARQAAMVWLFWSTGARRNEIANLQLADLDWDRDRIRVFGKGAKERYVPFTKEAKKAVWRYLSYRKDDYPHLWLTEERKPAQGWMTQGVMRRLRGWSGVKTKDLHHAFRRSWAWRMLKAGVPIEYVRLVGGWESVQVLEGYVRAMRSEEAIESVLKNS
jgi:integrase/recombinase XerD